MFDFHSFPRSEVSIDLCHNLLLYGVVASVKPDNVLELGIGSGFVTRAVLDALQYNGKGRLTSVDNYYDWQGIEPPLVAELRLAGAEIVAPVDEGEFVRAQQDASFDILVSDADHNRCGDWLEDVFRIVRTGGLIFVHDVFYSASAHKYLETAERLGKSHFLFDKSSRSDERCERAWLMIRV